MNKLVHRFSITHNHVDEVRVYKASFGIVIDVFEMVRKVDPITGEETGDLVRVLSRYRVVGRLAGVQFAGLPPSANIVRSEDYFAVKLGGRTSVKINVNVDLSHQNPLVNIDIKCGIQIVR